MSVLVYLDGQIVESVVSLAIMCQLLCIVAVNSLPMSEKGVLMGRMFVTVCGVRWDNKLLRLWSRLFFIFLMMRCSRDARASRVRVRLLSPMNDTFITAEWVVRVEVK